MSRDHQDRAGRAAAQWQREMPQIDVNAMKVMGRANELALRLGRDHLRPFFASHGLQAGEFDVLATLRRSGAPHTLTPTQLYRDTMLSSGAMTARLDRLETRGLIRRVPDPDDRRGTRVMLTDDGRALMDRIVPLHAANQTRLLAGLSDADRDALSELLAKALAALDRAEGA